MADSHRTAYLVFPHQLFVEWFDESPEALHVLVEDDLYFRQYPFHAQKLVLHRASMGAFAAELTRRGRPVSIVRSDPERTSMDTLADLLRERGITELRCFDVVDDWLSCRIMALAADLGIRLSASHVAESPNFLSTRADIDTYFDGHGARQHDFYVWQRKRLDVLCEGAEPVGGRWSFDEDNRKKLPKGYQPPAVWWPEPNEHVATAIASVTADFPNAPGLAHVGGFRYAVTHADASACLADFIAHRFVKFGPYEDAISTEHDVINHAVLTPALNIGLLSPGQVVDAALTAFSADDVPIASVEGFVRQVLGWREYMRATYRRWGRRMRSRNVLDHRRPVPESWWEGKTGLVPVDHVIRQVLRTGYCHHIERLMVLGNALCLLRCDPDAVYEWFMALFIDAYDWVMVPNTYAMSQFACGAFITTKPYVSGSNYIKKMSDFGPGPWRDAWDGLYWTFVRDHRAVFEANHRSTMVARNWDRMTEEKQRRHVTVAAEWLSANAPT